MLNTIKKYIRDYNLINGKKVVLALSGGIDSMTLLDVLLKLNYEVIVAHVNHKKRLASDMEEIEIKKICDRLNIVFEVLHLKEDKTANFHDYAHNKRYDFFIEVSHKHNASTIVTAHHKNDNLETILINLSRGSNLYGYGGISNKVTLKDLVISRPFLCVSKEDIINYASNKITFFEDCTNSEDHYFRNKIRHNIIPKLTSINEVILDKASTYTTLLQESFDFIRETSIKYLKENNNVIDVNSFKLLHVAIKKDLLCYMLETLDIEKNNRIIDKLLMIIDIDKPQLDYNLKNNYIFKKRYDKCFIELSEKTEKLEIKLNSINDTFSNDKYKIYFSKTLDCIEKKHSVNYLKICYNNIAFPLLFRTRQSRDAIRLKFGRKKIKDLFIDKKIPNEKRESILLLVDNNDEILYVCGLAISQNIVIQKDIFDFYLIIEKLEEGNVCK